LYLIFTYYVHIIVEPKVISSDYAAQDSCISMHSVKESYLGRHSEKTHRKVWWLIYFGK